MHKYRYIDKINSLLDGTNTDEISTLTTINNDIMSFYKTLKYSSETKK